MVKDIVTCPCGNGTNCDATPNLESWNSCASMKMADVIEYNFELLEVLMRLDIGLGFGEQTVTDVCAAHGYDISSFILICNAYSVHNYVPSEDLLASANVGDIIKYLHISHSVYLDDRIVVLGKSLAELIAPTDSVQKKIVGKFFADFHSEVAGHFSYEESVTFPYVAALLAGEKREKYSMDIIEENHGNMMEKLGDLKTIVMKYLPTSCDNGLRNKVLLQIFNLEEDLRYHILIEDDIMVPLMNILEKNGR